MVKYNKKYRRNVFDFETEEKMVIKKSKFGFMSNINEIMTDTFFVKGVVGTFAEEIVDQLIRDINLFFVIFNNSFS